ncbi:MAG: hypothetical protein COA82_00435 [Alkaliphilus sp.]|nr:MAG: hypothetical protein COA82_00435 [Alkaliphilus sp.]
MLFGGLFIGHILKDRVFALLLTFLTANQWFLYAITTPIAPMYFLHRIISKFIFIPGGMLITVPDFKYYYIFILLTFLALMLLLSQKLLHKRFARAE